MTVSAGKTSASAYPAFLPVAHNPYLPVVKRTFLICTITADAA
jgi:hypothetical protein